MMTDAVDPKGDRPASSPALAWNVLITAKPEPGSLRELLRGLRKFGEFDLTPYACVCTGRVQVASTFLDAVLEAEQAARPWTARLSRIVPVVCQFDFSRESLAGKLQLAARALAEEARGGTFQVRAELRGLGDDFERSAVEAIVAGALSSGPDLHGKSLLQAFDDADYLVAVELVGESCGLGLLSRPMRSRYPFVRVA